MRLLSVFCLFAYVVLLMIVATAYAVWLISGGPL